jgi:hypothetical protein
MENTNISEIKGLAQDPHGCDYTPCSPIGHRAVSCVMDRCGIGAVPDRRDRDKPFPQLTAALDDRASPLIDPLVANHAIDGVGTRPAACAWPASNRKAPLQREAPPSARTQEDI